MTLNRRMTMTAAFAFVLVSTVLYPLFIGLGVVLRGLGAVITVAAVGALSRLRTLPVVVCLAISVPGLLLYLNLVFEARHSWLWFIPTPGSISRLWDLAGTGFTDSSKYAPPVPERAGLVLLATAGIGMTAMLTDLIAVRLRSTALAGLPLLVLFTVPVTMNAPHEGLGTAIVFCLGTAGYLAMLSADGRERIRVWGRLVSLWRTGSAARVHGTTGPDNGRVRAPYPGVRPGRGDGTGRAGSPTARQARTPERWPRRGGGWGSRRSCSPCASRCCVPGLHPSKLFASGPGIGGTGGSGGGAVGLPDALPQTSAQLQQKTPDQVLTYTTPPRRTCRTMTRRTSRPRVRHADRIGLEAPTTRRARRSPARFRHRRA